MTKIKVLAKYLEEKEDEITELSNNLFELGNQEYLVLTDEEADKECTDYFKENVWAFNSSFIIGECGLDYSGEESLRKMQRDSCENANDFILSLIEKTCGLESFIEEAIKTDGRGHFLSAYDGNEGEEGIYYIYRTN